MAKDSLNTITVYLCPECNAKTTLKISKDIYGAICNACGKHIDLAHALVIGTVTKPEPAQFVKLKMIDSKCGLNAPVLLPSDDEPPKREKPKSKPKQRRRRRIIL